MTRALLLAAGLALTIHAPAARAGESADLLTRHAAAGTLRAGEIAIAARPASDPETSMALGFLRFARAIEKLGQGFHRHGFQTPSAPMMPMFRLPVPDNPNPEALDYQKLRAIYASFVADLALAESSLRNLPPGDVKIPLDLMAVRLDLNGDLKGSDDEALGALIRRVMEPPRNARRRGAAQTDSEPAPQPFVIAFDRADALWLQGYINLVSAAVEFVLAHDWQETYNASAHRFFKGARNDARLAEPSGPDMLTGSDGGMIADFIAFVHLVRWPVAEPARMQKSHAHMKRVIALSRDTWKEIRAEKDDDREWLPGPHQKTSAVTGLEVTDERVDGWLKALDQFEAALDGKKLIPHWRFNQGIDLKAVFHEPRPFDLVLWATGHAAAPYLKTGETISQSDWAQWQRIFGGNFLAYAFWFN